jgi:hypothetical protein
LEYDPGSPLENLFADIPNDGKTKIALIVPVRNLSKEEAETLVLPLANKQAKSPTGVAIPKRGGKRGRGGRGGRKLAVKTKVIKEEGEEVDKLDIQEEIEEEDDELLDVNEINKGKRKYIRSSKYPEDEYEVN